MPTTTHTIERSVEIDFTFVPEEPQTREHPGAPPYVEINRLTWVDTGKELTRDEASAFEAELTEAAHTATYGEYFM